MPYGLPGAVKIARPVIARDWQTLDRVPVQAGTIVQPVHPGADQDGWDGEWRCRTADGFDVAIPGDYLRMRA